MRGMTGFAFFQFVSTLCIAACACTEVTSSKANTNDVGQIGKDEPMEADMNSEAQTQGGRASPEDVARASSAYKRLRVPSKQRGYARFESGMIRNQGAQT